MTSFHFEDIPFELIMNQATIPDPILDNQGSYTRGDLVRFPVQMRVQLIDGWMIIPPPVPEVHQNIIAELMYQWTRYLKEEELPFKAVSSPVRFSRMEDDRTVLIPDLAVVRHPESILCPDIHVLPDFVAEVTTRGTNCLDHVIKSRIYRDWGVKEYWIINPQTSCIEIHDFKTSSGEPTETHAFGASVPVRSYAGFSIHTAEFL